MPLIVPPVDFRFLFDYVLRMRTAEAPTIASMQSCLAYAPLSRTDIDRALRLPTGAARRRRLFVVIVNAERVPGTSIGRGDRLIVEPGCHSSVDRLVVVRDDGRPSLRRVRLDGRGEPVLAATDPEALPFPQTVARKDILGSVIAVLGASPQYTGAMRERTDAQHQVRPVAPAPSTDDDLRLRRANRVRAELNLASLTRWIDGHQGDRRWAAVIDRLTTLHRCLVVVTDDGLYEALVAEINRVVARAARAAGRGADRPALRPLPYAGRRRISLPPRRVPTPSRTSAARSSSEPRTGQLVLGFPQSRRCRRAAKRTGTAANAQRH